MKLLSNYLFVFFVLFIASCNVDEKCGYDTNCEDYISQAAAQLAYDLDPNCRGDLDADNDGEACEEWETHYQNQSSGSGSGGGVPTGCPPTSACGCSGHNKAECEADPCCKWTVGEGCGCL